MIEAIGSVKLRDRNVCCVTRTGKGLMKPEYKRLV